MRLEGWKGTGSYQMRRQGRGNKFNPARYRAEYLNVSRGIDPVKSREHELFQNRERVRTVTSPPGRRDMMTPVFNNTFMQPVPRTRNLSVKVKNEITGKEVSVPTPRRMTLERKFEEKLEERFGVRFWSGTDRFQGFTKWHFIKVPDTDCYKDIRLYFNQDRWILVKLFPEKLMIMWSNVYKSEYLARAKHAQGRIFWAGTKKFPS